MVKALMNGKLFGKRKFTVAIATLLLSFVLALSSLFWNKDCTPMAVDDEITVVCNSDFKLPDGWVGVAASIVGLFSVGSVGTEVAKRIGGKNGESGGQDH